MISFEIITVLFLLAAAAVMQFFRGRKLNLQLVEYYMTQSVEVFRPKDKNFTWLGGYIGYRAEFELEDSLKLEYTLTLLPRQSLLYFPISLLTHRHDKLYVVFRLKSLGGEAHLIRRGYYRFRPRIENEIALTSEIVRVGDVEYELLYDRKKYADWILKFVEGFSSVDNIKHVSLTASTKVLYILMKPEPETIRRDFEYMYSYLRSNAEELK